MLKYLRAIQQKGKVQGMLYKRMLSKNIHISIQTTSLSIGSGGHHGVGLRLSFSLFERQVKPS